MAQSIQLSDMHTVGIHHICHDIGCHVSYGSFFRLTLKVNVHCQWDILLHTMTNFFFSRTAHWHIMHATESNCRRANSQLHCWAVKLNTVIKRSEAH